MTQAKNIANSSNPDAIRAVTMHPFVSGAKRFSKEQLDCPGREALLKIRRFNSRMARTVRNMREEVEFCGGTDVQPPKNRADRRLTLLRVAYNDPKVPADLHEIIGTFLPREELFTTPAELSLAETIKKLHTEELNQKGRS